jgi:hypothetical protein
MNLFRIEPAESGFVVFVETQSADSSVNARTMREAPMLISPKLQPEWNRGGGNC